MSGMFGETAAGMLKELKKSHWLPAYNDDSMRRVIREIKDIDKWLSRGIEAIKESGGELTHQPLQGAMRLHHIAGQRNQRAALAYLVHRAKLLENLWWEVGPVTPEDKRAKLSHHEINYYQA